LKFKKTKHKVSCVSAASPWYEVGKEYDVYEDTKGVRFVVGSDGYYDQIGKMASRFREVKVGQGN